MKVYPNKSSQVNKYQLNLREIAKKSNYQPIPSIPPLSEDFNFTFRFQDYDETNPYLKKDSLNRVLMKKKDKQSEESYFQQSLLLLSPLSKNNNAQFKQKKAIDNFKQDVKQFKLPFIGKRHQNKNSRQNLSNSLSRRNQELEKSLIERKNATIDTRIQTDAPSLLEEISSGSLLKLQTKQKQKSFQNDPFSSLIISKITIPNLHRNNENFLERNNLYSRDLSDFSQLLHLSQFQKRKNISNPQIIEQSSCSQSSDDQYQKNALPGPGYYSISNYSDFPKVQSTKNSTVGSGRYSFGSVSRRFQSPESKLSISQYSANHQKKLLEYEQMKSIRQKRIEKLKLNNKEKKIIPFGSSEQKIKQITNQNIAQSMISPLYYNPRYGIQQELIKKIQHNFKGNFGVSQKRFRTIYKKNSNTGPGKYNIEQKFSDEDLTNRQAYYFLSKKQRFQ